MDQKRTAIEKHKPVIWGILRTIEIVTCFFIIAGVIKHWN